MAVRTRKPKIVVKTGPKSKKPHVVVKGGNGEPVLTSENYANKANAEDTKKKVKKLVRKAIVEKTKSVSKSKKKAKS